MTCLNYVNKKDQWSIDHIIPIMYNNPTETEIRERLHYSNLQPMFENGKKCNSIRLEDIQVLANNWKTLSPALQLQTHQIRHNDPIVNIYEPVTERKKIKIILKKQ